MFFFKLPVFIIELFIVQQPVEFVQQPVVQFILFKFFVQVFELIEPVIQLFLFIVELSFIVFKLMQFLFIEFFEPVIQLELFIVIELSVKQQFVK